MFPHNYKQCVILFSEIKSIHCNKREKKKLNSIQKYHKAHIQLEGSEVFKTYHYNMIWCKVYNIIISMFQVSDTMSCILCLSHCIPFLIILKLRFLPQIDFSFQNKKDSFIVASSIFYLMKSTHVLFFCLMETILLMFDLNSKQNLHVYYFFLFPLLITQCNSEWPADSTP